MAAKKRRGYRTVKVELPKSELTLYGSARLMDAAETVETVTKNMTLYQGVKFGQILEAVYLQGKKDGAREAFGQVDKNFKEALKMVPHRRPGRPIKKRK